MRRIIQILLVASVFVSCEGSGVKHIPSVSGRVYDVDTATMKLPGYGKFTFHNDSICDYAWFGESKIDTFIDTQSGDTITYEGYLITIGLHTTYKQDRNYITLSGGDIDDDVILLVRGDSLYYGNIIFFYSGDIVCLSE